MPYYQTRSCGFSLIEMMIVLAIIAIVAAIATPNFRNSILSNRRVSATNNLLGALQLARSEAVTRRSDNVRVCASTDGKTCAGTDWSSGGIVLDGVTLLRNIPPAKGVAINGDAITFKRDGTTTASSITVDNKTISVNIVGAAKINR